MASDMTWAVIDESGSRICDYDSIDDLSADSQSVVPTEPQENGALYAYDKVSQPAQAHLALLFSGDVAAQTAALAKLEAARKSLKLFTIVTPYRVVERMALIGISEVRASSGGMNLLTAELTFQEVKVANISGATVEWKPANATSANQVDVGKKQSAEGGFLADLIS